MKTADPNFEKRARESFARQTALSAIGAEMATVQPGTAELRLRFNPGITQQHGYAHGGVIATIADTACGYAAMSLVAADTEVLTVEFKINFVNPARGELFIARGRVKKAGRTLTVCEGEVTSGDTTIALILATIMSVRQT